MFFFGRFEEKGPKPQNPIRFLTDLKVVCFYQNYKYLK